MARSLLVCLTMTGGANAINEAMNAYADGDTAAFSTLYDLIAPRLFGFAMRETGRHATAEDVVQQTMLQVHAARDRFRRGADVLPWIFAIARHVIIDGFRLRRNQEILVEEESVSRADAPDEVLEGKRMAAALRSALREMAEPQRVAFQLIREEGLSVAQAAEALGISEGAVRVRAHRAHVALREVLEQRERSAARPRI